MTVRRSRAREQALLILYARDLNPESSDISEINLSKEDKEFSDKLVQLFYEHAKDIDELITAHLRKWSFGQLHVVDKNILRLAIAEYVYGSFGIDRSVVINEAVEFAKIYGDADSYRFINGLLDTVLEKRNE